MSELSGRRFRSVGQVDRAVSRALAAVPESAFDRGMVRLTTSANRGGLWLGIAAALSTRQGPPRRAALRGVVAVAGSGLLVNVVLKTLVPRRRPAADLMPVGRRLIQAPTSSSFPSGHAANAAAFATAVALESPRTALFVAPVAAAVGYSRVHTGVHWGSDVLAGAAVGAAVALTTRRWWPVRESDEAEAHPVHDAPVLPEGKGLVLIVNPNSGNAAYDPTPEIARTLPAATLVHTEPGVDASDLLDRALTEAAEAGTPAAAVGAAGGDGTIAAAAAVAVRHGLPLVVVPAGTLNHFARDLGVYDLREVADATGTGEAVEVDIAAVDFETDGGPRRHYLVNTASIGAYPDLVRLREKWEKRWGKWPAFAAALVITLRRTTPLRVRLDGREHAVWFVFVGNGPYHPHGAVPAFRSRLDEGLLDLRWLRADLRFSRTRAVLALALAAIGHSKVYGERQARQVEVELPEPTALAADGEVLGDTTRLRFSVAGRIPVYRRDEDNPRWATRPRPHFRRGLPWLTR
ncbi:bifunctional phosphatase PAP2/diacylglycerol kinase family protein [Nocardia thailandica]|uniref:bifunctional phosphatase PAP2/diacylglycerol kinase family protein n=1 Tax=Nocardia thailandica TaxID=257275 RepID=UPI0005BA35AE|nr:bifunctional phosphatase PAP2/diacylglycerol kinase family protein [Nocardia thailandica]